MHALELEEQAWVHALFEEGRALFDEGQGFFVYSYRIGRSPVIRLEALAGERTAPAIWQSLSRWGSNHAGALARIYSTRAGGTAAGPVALRRPIRALFASLESHAITDLLTIVAHDADGFGVFLTAPRLRKVNLTGAALRSHERLAVDLSAALRLRDARHKAELTRLSAREQVVMRLLANGASDKDIAVTLGVGLSTVSTFARRARNKLGCRPGGEALLLARANTAPKRGELFARLTPSECDVAADLLVGRTYAEIALRRESSQRTVAAQCAAIFRKCGATGQRALAAAMLGDMDTSGKYDMGVSGK